MPHPLRISIVTPSYNQGGFLEATLRSVLDQNDPDLQYVVVDGGSKDASPEIIRKHAARLAWWVSEKDRGHADALNKGFARTDGEIMAWLNSDDLYFPWTFRLVREIFEKFPEIEWLTGIPTLWNAQNQLIDVHKGDSYLNKWDFMGGRYQWIQQESTFWRRSLWEKSGAKIDDSGTLMIDGELWSRFFRHAELWRAETLLGGYRLHGTNRAHAALGTVEKEMSAFCARMREESSPADRAAFDSFLALRQENPKREFHHPCCRYPSVFWSMESNAWEKGTVHKSHEWPSAESVPGIILPTSGAAEAADRPYAPDFPATLPDGRPWPKITVVTPSYNQGKFLEETIVSVHNQGYPDVEHIVIDGGSTDESLDIIRKHAGKLAYWVSEKDRGQSHAINKGFARGTGEIFTWLNSDDQFAPGALAAMAMAFHAHPEADMVSGIAEIFEDGRLVHRHHTSCQDGPLPLEDLLNLDGCWMAGQFFYQPEVFFTRNLWERAGGQVREDLQFSMDYELWVRFAWAKAHLHVIGAPIVHFRIHPDQKTNFVTRGFKSELAAARDGFVAKHLPSWAPPEVPANRKGRLRIAMVNDVGYQYGAGIAHARMARSLCLAGHDVASFSAHHDTLDSLPKEISPYWIEPLLQAAENHKPDCLLIGNIHNARMDANHVARLANRIPTLLTLHDLWWMTGRCAYPGPCGQHARGCAGECPTADQYPVIPRPLIPTAWLEKRALLKREKNLHLLANSRWTQARAREAGTTPDAAASAAATRTHRVFFGIDQTIFRPRARKECRESLGLPQDRFIILFSASHVNDPRKGIHLLADALRRLGKNDILPICVGVHDDLKKLGIPNLRTTGYVRDPQMQARLLAAADVFVGPSTEEAFGQVFAEAASCGTPSVGFRVGGIPDALVDGITGLLVPSVDSESLAKAILRLYEDRPFHKSLGAWAALHARGTWSPESAYHALFPALRAASRDAGCELIPKISYAPALPPPPPLHTFVKTGTDASMGRELPPPPQWSDVECSQLAYRFHRGKWDEAKAKNPLWWLQADKWFHRLAYKSAKRKLKRRGAPVDHVPSKTIHAAAVEAAKACLLSQGISVGPSHPVLFGSGWSADEGRLRWSDGKASDLRFVASWAGQPPCAFSLTGTSAGRQAAQLILNGQPVFSGDLPEGGFQRIDLPSGLLRNGQTNLLECAWPDACSPHSGETRMLAFGFQSFALLWTA